MNDTGIFASCFVFLLSLEFLFASVGVATGHLTTPGDGNFSTTPAGTTQTSSAHKVACAAGFALIGFLASFFHCSIQDTFHNVPVIGAVADFLQVVVNFIVAAWQFFLQFVNYQLSIIPFWVNFLVIVPPSVVLVVIGLRFIRNGGG